MTKYVPQAVSQADGYKLSHKAFMAEGTTKLYINMTARSGKYMKWQDSEKRIVLLGIQKFVKDVLIAEWNATFFKCPWKQVKARWKERVDSYLGPDAVSMEHFEALHKLGYLPLKLKALPEGSKVPTKVALLTVTNTHPDFAWLVTYIETVLSNELWPVITSATTAYQFLTLCNRFADETCGNRLHVPFQCHDFADRGCFGRHAAVLAGLGHSLSFAGTDSIPTLDAIDAIYGGYPEGSLIGCSVPASEHSVTSLGIAVDGELETIKRWITKDYPVGIVSVVSDTIDYWKVVTEYLPALEPEIRARKPAGFLPGKVVVRPDSGDPIRIICGYREDELVRTEHGVFSREEWNSSRHDYNLTPLTEYEIKGTVETLYDLFGGTINQFGYKLLDDCIGLIYGDSITIERAEEIFRRLQQRGFASSNVVFGVGSYTYQMVSRDTLGLAVKATYAEVNGKPVELYKDPKTDDGTKKSARGLIRVDYVGTQFWQVDQVSSEREEGGALRTVFEDGKLLIDENFITIKNRLHDIKEEE